MLLRVVTCYISKIMSKNRLLPEMLRVVTCIQINELGRKFIEFKVLPSKPILRNIWDSRAPSFAHTLVSGVEIRYKILPSICIRLRCLKIFAIRSINCVTFLWLNAFAERYSYVYKDYAWRNCYPVLKYTYHLI